MKISIRNYRGVAAADLDHGNITFIGGRNHQGKSSLCQAIAAVLTGEMIPFPGLPKSKIKKIVRDGAKSASCKIIDGETQALITWPDCNYHVQGPAVKHITQSAAGMASILDSKEKKDRVNIIANYIKSDPTLEDLTRELKAADIPAAVAAQLVEAVKISGYLTMHAKAKEKGSRLKGQWEFITGQHYGSLKIAGWAPPAWFPELENADPDQLQADINQLKSDLEAGIAAAAVSGQLVDQLKAEAGGVDACQKDLKIIAGELETATRNETQLQKEFLRLSDMPTEYACPHCGAFVQLKDDKLIVYEEMEQSEIDDRTTQLKNTGNQLDQARANKRDLMTRQIKAQDKLRSSRSAAAELKKIDNAKGGEKWANKVDDLRTKLVKGESDLKALHDKRQADQLANAIKANKAIQDILGPDGLRKTKLNEALTPFNQGILDLCQAAGWATVRMDVNYDFYMNDRPIVLCSTSETYQARTILQLALAKIEGAGLVLIDGADVIIGKERNGLFAAILKNEVPAIVFMSMPDPDKMPAMEKIGGQALWIEKGEIIHVKK